MASGKDAGGACDPGAHWCALTMGSRIMDPRFKARVIPFIIIARMEQAVADIIGG